MKKLIRFVIILGPVALLAGIIIFINIKGDMYYYSTVREALDKPTKSTNIEIVGKLATSTEKDIVILYDKKKKDFLLWNYQQKKKNGKLYMKSKGWEYLLFHTRKNDSNNVFIFREEYLYPRDSFYYPDIVFGVMEQKYTNKILVDGKRPNIEIINYKEGVWAFWYVVSEKYVYDVNVVYMEQDDD
jgi:hypothetical protein